MVILGVPAVTIVSPLLNGTSNSNVPTVLEALILHITVPDPAVLS
jgi:hypothetical protein